MDWLRKHFLAITILLASWVFTIGYVKAETEWRLTALEQDVATVQIVVGELKTVTTRLEVITSRLERMLEKE
tara:strand:+ start:866 stop:1081 length:216 start_codon:yes stop_codon:yes gene_type:complete